MSSITNTRTVTVCIKAVPSVAFSSTASDILHARPHCSRANPPAATALQLFPHRTRPPCTPTRSRPELAQRGHRHALHVAALHAVALHVVALHVVTPRRQHRGSSRAHAPVRRRHRPTGKGALGAARSRVPLGHLAGSVPDHPSSFTREALFGTTPSRSSHATGPLQRACAARCSHAASASPAPALAPPEPRRVAATRPAPCAAHACAAWRRKRGGRGGDKIGGEGERKMDADGGKKKGCQREEKQRGEGEMEFSQGLMRKSRKLQEPFCKA
jgi:hypothetical protein